MSRATNWTISAREWCTGIRAGAWDIIRKALNGNLSNRRNPEKVADMGGRENRGLKNTGSHGGSGRDKKRINTPNKHKRGEGLQKIDERGGDSSEIHGGSHCLTKFRGEARRKRRV